MSSNLTCKTNPSLFNPSKHILTPTTFISSLIRAQNMYTAGISLIPFVLIYFPLNVFFIYVFHSFFLFKYNICHNNIYEAAVISDVFDFISGCILHQSLNVLACRNGILCLINRNLLCSFVELNRMLISIQFLFLGSDRCRLRFIGVNCEKS